MSKRPRSVTVISWISIPFGGLVLFMSLLPKQPGAEASLAGFRSQHPFVYAYIVFGAALAVVCGVFMLRGRNWARWLFVLWFGYNVISKVVHSPLRLLIPGLLFAVVVYLLFRPQASDFFRQTEAPQIPKTDGTPLA
jgi:hypothetical protein